ncbi:Uncharacterised protein [Mycobacteroides abscessus subsp. abscessus]|nr:Uncharacterised protein [Mycobacteroides abscessus subsp. abscessus]
MSLTIRVTIPRIRLRAEAATVTPGSGASAVLRRNSARSLPATPLRPLSSWMAGSFP